MTPRPVRNIVVAVLFGCVALAPQVSVGQITYIESGGQVVAEAELFSSRTASANDAWTVRPLENAGTAIVDGGPIVAGARGGLYVQSLADNSTPGGVNVPPEITFRMNITTTGMYEAFLRWDGNNTNGTTRGQSDSIFIDIVELKDGAGGAIPDWYELTQGVNGNFGSPAWDGGGGFEANSASAPNNPLLWNITAPGIYTFRVTQREDGSAVDAFVFQLQSLATPTNPTSASAELTVAGTTSAAVDAFSGNDAATLDFGNVRVGTMGSANLGLSNTGSGTVFSATASAPSGDGDFTGAGGSPSLTAGAGATNLSYSFSPDQRGIGLQAAMVDVTSSDLNMVQNNDVAVTLQGIAVGPVFGIDLAGNSDVNQLAAPGGDTSGSLPTDTNAGSLNLGTTSGMATGQITIGNITTDNDLLALTDLTIAAVSFTGPDADKFSLLSDPTGAVMSGGLSNPESILDLVVKFTVDHNDLGAAQATLNLFTDQGVAAGANNNTPFQISLSALAVPEPSAYALWGLLAIGFAGIAVLRCRQAAA